MGRFFNGVLLQRSGKVNGDTAEPQALDTVFQLLSRQVGILQRHRGEGHKAVRLGGAAPPDGASGAAGSAILQPTKTMSGMGPTASWKNSLGVRIVSSLVVSHSVTWFLWTRE